MGLTSSLKGYSNLNGSKTTSSYNAGTGLSSKLKTKLDTSSFTETDAANKPMNVAMLNRVSDDSVKKFDQTMSEEKLYQAGLTDDNIRKTDEWKAINKRKLAQRLQEEQDNKSTVLKTIENVGSKMKQTVFGKDLQRETADSLGVNTSTGNKVLDTATDVGGTILGYAMPMGEAGSLLNATSKLGEKALEKVSGKVTNKLAQKAIKGAVETAPLSLYSSTVQGEDAKTAAKRLATETALGAAGEVGVSLIGKGYQSIRNLLKKPVSEIGDMAGKVTLEQIKPTDSLKVKSGTGAYKIKNTAYEKALDDYNSAIKTVQDYFKTNELRVDEIKSIKDKLGIDLEEITDRLAKYETKTGRQVLNDAAEQARLKRVSGLGSNKEYSIMSKAAKSNSSSEGLLTTTNESVEGSINRNSDFYKAQSSKPTEQIKKEIDSLNATKSIYQARINEVQKAIDATPNLSNGARMQRELEIGKLNKNIADIEEKLKVNLQLFGEKQPVVSEVSLPKGTNQSKFAQTIADSQNTASELSNDIKDKNILYDIKPNEQTLQRAKDIINNNYDEAIRMAKDMTGASAEHSAVSQLLIQRAQQEGRWQDAIELVETATKRATNQGQAIQALSMWNRLTPEGMLKYAQNTIDKANKELPNGKKLKLPEKLVEDIKNTMDDISKMEDGRDKTVKTAQLLDKIHSQVPANILTKISSLQALAQLLNPKTAIRNILGNAVFGATENISKVVGVPIDAIISKVTGERTALMPSLKTQAEGFAKGFKNGLEDAIKGIDTSGLSTQFDRPAEKVFKGKILGGLEKAMNIELKATDRAFYTSAFEDSLREQMKIAKADVPTQQMIENAHLDGLYRTFQDTNSISTRFSGLKRVLNGGKQFGLGDFVMKYPKTPANILARGIDYSPIGIGKGLIELAKMATKSEGSQRKAVQELSRGIVGSGILGAGMALAKLGILTGKTDKDKDAKDFKTEIGLGGYKLNLDALQRFVGSGFNPEEAKPKNGDTIMNYDWLQPTAMSLSAGVNVAEKQKANAADVLGAISTTLYSGMDTLAEQPVLSGILNVFNGYDSGDKLTGALKAIATGAPTSFMPTLLNQVRQLTDNTSRNTNADSVIDKTVNMIKNKVPGLSKSLPENVSVTGETKQIYKTGNNPFNVFFNPAFLSKYEVTPGTKMLMDLYEKTDDVKQFPRKVTGTITINGKKVDLSESEKADLQKIVGNKSMELIEKAAKSEAYNKLKDEDKVKYIVNVLSAAGDYGRNELIKKLKSNGASN